MKKLYARFTQIVYFVGYPFFALVLHNTRRVRVLICSRDAVVLVRTSVGRQEWSLPGGGIEKEEADDHAAIREVREETGLRLTKDQLKPIGEEQAEIYKNRTWPKVQLVFYQADVPVMPPLKSPRPLEILEARWFKVGELPAKRGPEVDRALSLAKLTK